jgi:uncharacterized membrane protein YkvA (DUF1232 family)
MKFLRYFHLLRAWRSFANAFRMMRSPRVPMRLKLIVAVLALLIISPLNILGDIPLIGIFDDVALLSMLAGWFVKAAGHHDALTTIEGKPIATR